mgnify:CR=1 FL=1
MKTHNSFILLILLLTFSSASAQDAQLASAKVIEVVGTVSKNSADGQSSQLKVGEIVKEGASITTAKLSMAKLVFSNGSEMTIEENTRITIAELQQDAFTGGKSYEQLQADPSKSQTLLELNYGEINGHTKKLQPGSNFKIKTPLGTAAIRGTRWSIMLIFNPERGEFILITNNKDGALDIISKYGGTVSDRSEKTEAVEAGKAAVITLSKTDPEFDAVFDLIKNVIPIGLQPPVITPGTPGPVPGPDDDFGIIVVSPEGPAGRVDANDDN